MSESLIWRIRNRDQQAMRELYQEYVEMLSSVCYRYVVEESDVKDVLQDSFVKILSSVGSFEYRDEISFRGWMKRIVANAALHFLKEKKRLQFTELNEGCVQQISDEEPNVELVSADELHRLVSELPDGYRTVVNLYVFEGYSHRKIAEMLSIKESTSASQFYHAKQLLAKRIKDLIDKKS